MLVTNEDIMQRLERRFIRVSIHPEMLLMQMRSNGKIFQVESNLPDDVTIYNAQFNAGKGVFEMILASESFEEVKEGALIPDKTNDILFKTIKYEQNTKEKDKE